MCHSHLIIRTYNLPHINLLRLALITFFSLLKHTCLIIFSIAFLIQPPDQNEVFWLAYNNVNALL